jgi:release factor glutamine methyltransferase
VIDALLRDYTERLRKAGVLNPEGQARLILEKFCKDNAPLNEKMKARIEDAIQRRERRMPLERIFGSADMCGITIKTGEGVYKPYPETEDIIHYAVTLLSGWRKAPRILDLGTGTGCILLSLLRALPQATGVGVDINEKALELAEENARLNSLQDRGEFRCGDWTEGLSEKFDLIISNPPRAATCNLPYLLPEMRNFDPSNALDGGMDGFSFIRRLVEAFDALSEPNGLCICEVGPNQAFPAKALFRGKGFRDVELMGNYLREPCCIVVRKQPSAPQQTSFWYKLLNFLVKAKIIRV